MNIIETVKTKLLTPAGITENHLAKILSQLLGYSVDNADLYFQMSQSEAWVIEDGIVKEGSFSLDKGVGVRAISGDKTGFAYTDDLFLPALEQAAQAARSIAHQGTTVHLKIPSHVQMRDLYAPINPLSTLTEPEKIAFLQKLDQEARSLDPRIKQVIVSLAGTQDIILMVNSDGSMAADIRPLVRLNVDVIVEQNGRRERGNYGGGGRLDYRYFLQSDLGSTYVHEAVRQAIVNLDAIPAPAGTMTVVLGPGWPAVLLHEAIGHGLEGDFNRKGLSAFSGRVGERVASPLCTIVDDGTLANRRGSLNVDDEGTETQCTTLIENGVLKGYMQDKLNAKLMGVKPTGNGRRESYANAPMPRMTNTYMLAGKHEPEEIISSVKKGLYAVNFSGGQVDITSGKFVFSTSEAYLIEDGKITHPVKGATLVGNGPDVLTRVSMVGNDLKLDSGVGTCGKDGQSVPVGVGQPTIKVDDITVGGTN